MMGYGDIEVNLVLPSKKPVHPFWKEAEKTLGSLCFVLTGLKGGS